MILVLDAFQKGTDKMLIHIPKDLKRNLHICLRLKIQRAEKVRNLYIYFSQLYFSVNSYVNIHLTLDFLDLY